MRIYCFLEKNDDKKGPLQFIKNNPALVVSIILQKHHFHGICAFSKKKIVNFTRLCAFVQKVKCNICSLPF